MSAIQPHDEATKVRAVDAAVELLEGDEGLSPTKAAEAAASAVSTEGRGVSGRSVLRWAEEQGRPLSTWGRRVQSAAAEGRKARYDRRERESHRARLSAVMEGRIRRLETRIVEGDDDPGVALEIARLVTAHKQLMAADHEDYLFALRTGDPDVLDARPEEDEEEPDAAAPNVSDLEEARRRALMG